MSRNHWPSLRAVVSWRVLIAAAAAFWLGAANLRADPPSVTAVLSNANTVVGQPVQLQIKISGSSSVKPPRDIFVDGLQIRYTGQSQLWEGRNFQFTYSFICNYTVMPMKAGTFKIPPQMVEAGGSALRTPELTLRVADSGTGPAPRSRNRSSTMIDPSKIAFAELMLSFLVLFFVLRDGRLNAISGRLARPSSFSARPFCFANDGANPRSPGQSKCGRLWPQLPRCSSAPP